MIPTQNRHVEQRNKIEDPSMRVYNAHHLILDKDAKNIQWKKKTSSVYIVGKSAYTHIEKLN